MPHFNGRALAALFSVLIASAPCAHTAEPQPNPAAAPETLLLLGFGPFAGRRENASWLAVKQFSEGRDVRAVEVPVIWGAPRKALLAASSKSRHTVIVALGEGSDRFQVETVAFNERARYRDEAKKLPPDPKAEPDGPDRRLLAGPASALARKLTQRGFPAQTSRDAGRFLCNEMLYELLRLQRANSRIDGVFFIHVPVFGTAFDQAGVNMRFEHAACARFGRALVDSLAELYPLAGKDLSPAPRGG